MSRQEIFYILIAAVGLYLYPLLDLAGAMGEKPGEGTEEIRMLVIPGGLGVEVLPEPESEGARLFSLNCGQCHNLPNPKMYSSGEWPMMFNRMLSHARTMASLRQEFRVPQEEEKEKIAEYLKRNGLRALPADDPSLKSPDAFQFVWFCSTCHSMPDPAMHTKGEWEAVVIRMEEYRRKQEREEMTSSEKKKILKFLTENQ